MSHGLVLVQVNPELPDVEAQAQQGAVWALRLAAPQERDSILRAVEADLNSDINYDAMLAALQLSKPQMAVLRAEYMARPLRALALEQPPRCQDPQAVVMAFWREVADHSRYLSIDDVWSLATAAAIEISRRIPGGLAQADLNAQAERLHNVCMAELRLGSLTRETDPWLSRPPGPLEAYLLAALQGEEWLSNAALPALLMAPARWLQDCLEQARTGEGRSSQQKVELGNTLKNAFEQLLNQSFTLGEDGPQELYEAFQHEVCAALDHLGFAHAHPVGTPDAELLQSIGFVAGQHDSDVNRLSPEQMAVLRDGFRASPLRRLICDNTTPPSFQDASIDALVGEVLGYRDYLSSREVGALIQSAAAEIVRRAPATTESLVREELFRRVANAGNHNVRRWAPERWDGNRTPGFVEAQVVAQIRSSMALERHAVPLMLAASARCLDELLAMRTDSPEERQFLATAIQDAFERLLGQSFALGANAPQDLYGTFAPVVSAGLRWLGHGSRPPVNTPTLEKLKDIGFIARQPGDSKGRPRPQRTDPVPFTADAASSSKKRSVSEMEGGAAPGLHLCPIEHSRGQTLSRAVQAATNARARLSRWRELQQDLLCLQHAYRNGWHQFLWLRYQEAQAVPFNMPAEPVDRGMELLHVAAHAAPDGHRMKVVRWTRAQLIALMPLLVKCLDLAIVYNGDTMVEYGDQERLGHFTSLILVENEDGTRVHYELDSLPADDASGIRWVQDLSEFFGRLPGGVWMAVRGNPDHPLSKYVNALSIEPFRRLCEAFGFILGRQPIMELLADDSAEGREPRLFDKAFAKEYGVANGFPNAEAYAHVVPYADGRSQAIVQWLDTLGGKEAILWTGTDPLVMAVTRANDGTWLAHVVDEAKRAVHRPLLEVLQEQQGRLRAFPPDRWPEIGGLVEALILQPLGAAESSQARPARSAVQPGRPVRSVENVPGAAPTSEAIRESEQLLMTALKTNRFGKDSSLMNAAVREVKHLGFEEAVAGLRQRLGANAFRGLITKAGDLKDTDKPQSEHLATLYVLYGSYPNKNPQALLSLLPKGLPACFFRYAGQIKARVAGWPDEFGDQVLAKLQLA
ncbi:hypothetical protein GCM10023165_33130 [Variovorax defluvii]|uniref:DUF4132 domain-containing protein n=2 Tax=Variovorax defluvii TaxID=913761 RepID=A0ABP8HYZ0_9BURK